MHLTCLAGNEYDLLIEVDGLEVQRGQVCRGREQPAQELPMLMEPSREADFLGCSYGITGCPVDPYQNTDNSLQLLWPCIDNAAG